MTVRIAAALALVAVVATATVIGTGGKARSANESLAWLEGPLTVVRGDSSDRIVSGSVVNRSDEAVELDAAKLKLKDDRGRTVEGLATFIPGYAHGVLPMDRGPYPTPERKRLGRIITLASGAQTRLTVAWRQTRATSRPVAVDYGSGTLRLPATRRASRR